MSKAFKAQDQEAQALIDTTAKEFSLNEAQERAFWIVANHDVENGEHLKMYLEAWQAQESHRSLKL